MEPTFQVLLYYLYSTLEEPESYLEEHRRLCEELQLRGRILIGSEGINGTVSGPFDATQRYMEVLHADPRTASIQFKVDAAEDHCFPKLSIKLRSEIVTLGLHEKDVDPNELTGKKLSPEQWKEALQDDDVVLLDARNNYETALGRFEGALCPDLEHFRDFPEWIRANLGHLKNQKVLTYCTGGIRCEKLSGFLLQEGFQDVSQLDGGIVNYGKDPQTRGEGFEGLCYVFDERVATEANFTESRTVVSHCEKCGQPSPRYRNCRWAPCNRQFFLCETCEDHAGRFCSEDCEASATAQPHPSPAAP